MLEIGAGSGRVTRRLNAMGASVVAVEPDGMFAALLRDSIAGLEVHEAPFEDADLPDDAFDIAVAATSFHWVEQDVGLPKLRRVLRRGGHVALWWEKIGDPCRSNVFLDATRSLWPEPSSPPDERPPYQLDVDGWKASLERVGIEGFEAEIIRDTVRLDAPRLRALFATWTVFLRLPLAEREPLLDRIAGVVDTDLDGVAELPSVVAVYAGRKP